MNTQTYTVNIRTGVVNITRVDVSQGDTGRTLAFKLYDGLIPFTPPSGSTVTIVGRKPSGLGFSETCTVSGNTAAVNTTLAMTQESGKFPVELRIESDTRSIGTANFVMHVEPSPHPTGTTDGTTEEARTVLEQCEEYAQAAQEAAEAASGDYTEIRSDVDDLTDRVDALEEGGSGGSGLTDAVKTAMMNLVNHLAWDDDDPTGQTYITALYNALYPPADLVSISAVYTQSGAVYETDALDDLKDDLVVTALMSDQTTRTITDYTLSGTLTAGTSTITVTYGGKTTTFSVTVTANPYLAYWDFTQSLVDTVNGYEFTLSKGTSLGTLERTSAGLVFSAPDTGAYGAVAKLDDSIVFPKGSKLTIEFGASNAAFTHNGGDKGNTYGLGNGNLMGGVISLIWRGSSDKFYSYSSSWVDRWIATTPDYFHNKTMVIEVASDNTRNVTVDGVAFGTVPGSEISSDTYTFFFGRKTTTDQTFHDIVIKKAYVEALSS